MRDFNYFSWFFLSMNCLCSASQDPEDAASPHGPDPASLGVPTSSAPMPSRKGMVACAGVTSAGLPYSSSWPLPCPGTCLPSDLVLRQGQASYRDTSQAQCSQAVREPSSAPINAVLPLGSKELGFNIPHIPERR